MSANLWGALAVALWSLWVLTLAWWEPTVSLYRLMSLM